MGLMNLCGAATLLVLASGASANLIPNGDFSSGFANWNTYPEGTPGTTVVADSGPAGAGDNAAHVLSTDWVYPAYTAWITPSAGDQGVSYEAYFDVKLGGFDGTKQTDVALERSWGGSYFSKTILQSDATLADGQWHRFTYPVTLDGSNLRFVTYTQGGGGTRDIWFDNFYVGAVPEPTALALIGTAGLLALRRRRA